MVCASCCMLHVLPVPGSARISTPCASCVPCDRAGDGASSSAASSGTFWTALQLSRRTPSSPVPVAPSPLCVVM